jgi:DNA-binding NarL/FixJ family response regulator
MVPLGKFSVLIVHHSPIMRLGLVTLINSVTDFTVVGETADAPTAVELAINRLPHIVIHGLTLQRGDGISLLKALKKASPTIAALVLAGRHDGLSIQRAFKAGAFGYVSTFDDTAEILRALKRISEGERYTSPSVSRELLKMIANGVETGREGYGRLSDRELQVFRLLGRGYGTSHVARELHVSVKTIETHQHRMKQKLDLANSAQLTRRAAEWLLSEARQYKYSQRSAIPVS